ncbi:fibronectin type III domain-containing protein 10 [Neosynchiropus ocellatus]
MKRQRRPSVLAMLALVLSTAGLSSASSSSPASSSEDLKTVGSPRLGEESSYVNNSRNTSRDNFTVTSSRPNWTLGRGVSPLCAYRVIEGGIGGQLCFRHTVFGYKCHKADCRTAVSAGKLVANLLLNGSVLLQWAHEEDTVSVPNSYLARRLVLNATQENTTLVSVGRRRKLGGFELNCWWNGSYTQFDCPGVHLGSGCRDFLMAELHENIPYRICLRPLDPSQRANHKDCVEFTLPATGMQDIVIAMTTVGGAICVMLVIICLLVAYITENIMSPSTQHAQSYRTHSHHRV